MGNLGTEKQILFAYEAGRKWDVSSRRAGFVLFVVVVLVLVMAAFVPARPVVAQGPKNLPTQKTEMEYFYLHPGKVIFKAEVYMFDHNGTLWTFQSGEMAQIVFNDQGIFSIGSMYWVNKGNCYGWLYGGLLQQFVRPKPESQRLSRLR